MKRNLKINVLLLLILFEIGCKKEALVGSNISDLDKKNVNSYKPLEELRQFSSQNKSDLELALKTGKINWNIVSLRLSSSAQSPVHLSYPIETDDAEIVKFLDVTYNADNKINGIYLIDEKKLPIDGDYLNKNSYVLPRHVQDTAYFGPKRSSDAPQPKKLGFKKMEGGETQEINNNCTVAGPWNFTITFWNGGDLNNSDVAGYARYKLENYLARPNNAFNGWSGFGSNMGEGIYSFYNANDGNQVRGVLNDALNDLREELNAIGIAGNISSFYFNYSVSCTGSGGETGGGNTSNNFEAQIADANVVNDGKPKIQNIKKYIDCFTDGKQAQSYTMTIYADQPVPETTDWFKLVTPGVSTNNPFGVPTGIVWTASDGTFFDVGHTFVTFEKNNTDGTNVRQTLGFYPSANPIVSKGTMEDNGYHAADVKYTMNVTKEQFEAALQKVESDFNTKDYVLHNLNSTEYNCTDAAVSWMNAAGANFGNSASGSFKNTPGGFGQVLRNTPGAYVNPSTGIPSKGPCN